MTPTASESGAVAGVLWTRRRPRARVIGRVVLFVALVVFGAACGGSSGKKAATALSTGSTASGPRFAAPLLVDHPRAAPPIRLRDQFGTAVNLAQFRGKAIMLTFVYAHCPDVCPLIMQALGRARRSLGAKAGRLQIVAVSVDPRGDKPAYVRKFLSERGLLHEVEYLLGSRAELAPVWKDYNVDSRRAKGNPELIEHSAFIYGIDRRGRIRTLYPASPLKAQVLAHDARLLAET
jgi:protein SCO1/2